MRAPSLCYKLKIPNGSNSLIGREDCAVMVGQEEMRSISSFYNPVSICLVEGGLGSR